MRRNLTVIAGLTAGMVVLASAASASGPPRLSGNFKVHTTITKNVGFPHERVGQSGLRVWTFTPKCAGGGCATALRRHTLSNTLSRDTLKPRGSFYEEKLTTSFECVTSAGQVVARDGYHTTFDLIVTPTSIVNGAVHAFHGKTETQWTPTAAGKAHHCAPATQISMFHSVSGPR